MTSAMTRAVRAAMAAAVVLASTGGVEAQEWWKVGGLALEGEIEAGGRAVLGVKNNERGKLEEYRDLTDGLFLPDFRLRLLEPNGTYAAGLTGSKWGQEDQEFALLASRLGLWKFGFDWNQTPHVYSTTGRTLANETRPGVWVLPGTRPALATHNSAQRLDEISQRWDTARVALGISPTADIDMSLVWTRIHKDGERPMSLAFGSPGNNFYEIPGTIDQTINDVRLSGSLARENWQIQFGYTGSFFNNGLRALVVDNPCFGATSGCGDAGAPPAGQLSLDPDNQAHTISIAGGVNLPLRTRLNTSLAYGVRLQNESFLPHRMTTETTPALLLTKHNLSGLVHTTLGNLNLTSRPLPWPITFSARYRIYDFVDESDQIYFAAHVVNDRTLSNENRRALRANFTRQNGDIDARWRFGYPLAVTIGTGWERWDRDEGVREVPQSDEFTGKAKVDWSPLDWLSVSGSYRPAFKRISNYDTFAHLAHTTEEDAGAVTSATQSTLLRKYDQGERDRQQFDVFVTITPIETLSTTLTAGWRHDDYIRSTLGLQRDTTWSAGMDVTWNPTERVSVFAGYVHESIAQRMRGRSRDAAGGAVLDFADFEWITDHVDTVETLHAGVSTTLIPKRLELNVTGSYSYALGRTDTNNPVPPASGSAAQDSNATARPFPAIENHLLRLETSLKYHFWKHWSASFGYVLESFEKSDWRTDTLNPFVPGTTGVFLGNDYRDYTAHIVGLTLGYRY